MTLLTPRQREESLSFPYSEYFVSFEHRFVCCAIPKNGCTAIKRWFLSVVEPAAAEVADVHTHCRDNHALHLHPTDVRDRVLGDFFCFTVLRDPFKRIASAFAEKFVGPALHEIFEPAREVIEENERIHGATAPHDINAEIVFPGRTITVPACSAIAYGRGVTFREFVRYLCLSPDEHLDSHWRPQAAFLAGNRFQSIGQMERLGDYLPAVARRLGVRAQEMGEHTPAADLPGDGAFHGDMLSRELHRRGIYPSAATLYDQEMLEHVRSRFEEDVRLIAAAATDFQRN